MYKLYSALSKAIKYEVLLYWKAHYFKIDFSLLDPSTTFLVGTKFGTSLDLQVIEKDTCATNNHTAVYTIRMLKD